MIAASAPRRLGSMQRMLIVDTRSEQLADGRVGDLSNLLGPGDLLVVNDAGTLPAALTAHVEGGADVELRLLGPPDRHRLSGIVLGAGTWRTDTDQRQAPPPLRTGTSIILAGGVRGVIQDVGPSPRQITLETSLAASELWAWLYKVGRPIQYSYAASDLHLADVQIPYATRPWAVEMPSAGRPLTIDMLIDLRRVGVELAALTHAAGLSATGDPTLDRQLPFPEQFEIPASTVDAIARTAAAGGRLIAVGTSVVRALESSARTHGGHVKAGPGTTDLRIGAGFAPQVVTGLLSGVHEPNTSHMQVLQAFASPALIEAAQRHAQARGYLIHEFGDSTLIAPDALQSADATRAGAPSSGKRSTPRDLPPRGAESSDRPPPATA